MNSQMEGKTEHPVSPKMSCKSLKREVRRTKSVKGRHMSKKNSKKQSQGSAKTIKTAISYEYKMKSHMTWEFADEFQSIYDWHEAVKGDDSVNQPIKIEPTMSDIKTVADILVKESMVENTNTGDDQQKRNTVTIDDEPVATGGCTFNSTVMTHSIATVYKQFDVQNDASADISLQTMRSSLQATDSKHQRKEKQFKCSGCLMEFICESALILNMRVHSGEKPFKCNECPKMFAQKSYLTVHQRIHSGEKPFKCNKCPKMFSQKSDLTRHQRVHSGEQPFKCTECPKMFSYKTDLARHQRVHSGVKPFKCKECPKMFSEKNNLMVHQLIHLGEKPFKCTHCPKLFSQNISLKRHLRIHSGDKPHRCPHCLKTFTIRCHVKRHILTHHADQV